MWVQLAVITEVGEIDCNVKTKDDKEYVIWWDVPESKTHKDESVHVKLTEFRLDDEVDIAYVRMAEHWRTIEIAI